MNYIVYLYDQSERLFVYCALCHLKKLFPEDFSSIKFSVTFSEFPDLQLPEMYPYVAPQPLVHDSVLVASLLGGKIHWEDFTVHGFESATVQEFRYKYLPFWLLLNC